MIKLQRSRYFLITLMLLTGIPFVYAQIEVVYTTSNKKAIAYYQEAENFWFRRQVDKAISFLDLAIKKDKKFAEAYLRQGAIYTDIGEFDKARVALNQVVSLQPDNKAFVDVYFLLARLHLEKGEYEKAQPLVEKFLNSKAGRLGFQQEAKKMLRNIAFAKERIKTPVSYVLEELPLTINQMPLQYFPTITADGQEMFFTIRKGLSPIDDEDIYIARKDNDGKWSNPTSISDNINTKFNEGTSTISADGHTLIFTACNGRKVFGSCDLFYTTRKGEEWEKPMNMGSKVNSRHWDSQPSLSADGRMLFFSSDRSGGKGRRDIWYSQKDVNGDWSAAKNLGAPINTVDNDLSPFIHVNGQTLFFASDGHPGFGSFDLYKSEINEQMKWGEPENLGYPINDFQEQVGLVVNTAGDMAYFSHENRHVKTYQKGKIFKFKIPKSISVKNKSSYVKGRVLDAQTGNVLAATIDLYKLGENKSLSTVMSDETNGKYLMVLTEGADYVLYVNKPGYLFSNEQFSYKNKQIGEPVILDIQLQPIQKGKVTALNNIFFEEDSYEIKEISVTELQRVYEFMVKNKSIKIGVGGHTDNAGSDEYNLDLSKNRAKAVYNYLITLGIDKDRLRYKGYGESKPLVSNDTPKGRAKNRRIEFIIL